MKMRNLYQGLPTKEKIGAAISSMQSKVWKCLETSWSTFCEKLLVGWQAATERTRVYAAFAFAMARSAVTEASVRLKLGYTLTQQLYALILSSLRKQPQMLDMLGDWLSYAMQWLALCWLLIAVVNGVQVHPHFLTVTVMVAVSAWYASSTYYRMLIDCQADLLFPGFATVLGTPRQLAGWREA